MKTQLKSAALFACCAALIAAPSYAQSQQERDLAPTGRGIGTRYFPAPPSNRVGPPRVSPERSARGGSNVISYHGGPLLGISSPPNVYFIWYGNWANNSATSILPNLALNIGGSSYFNINTTYYDASGAHVMNAVNYVSSTSDNYSQGTSLRDSSVEAVVARAINNGELPRDPDGVYFVLTSKDVNETSGFCTQYCGWHTNGAINGADIKYAFIGNPDRCPSACEAQTTSPNGNAGADGMASIIAHELEESVTDPDGNAWYDRRGEESADKCAWTFGALSTASNGSKYNITLGKLNYLIQQNWVNAGAGYCAMSY